MDWAKTAARRDEKHARFGFGASCIRGFMVYYMYYNFFVDLCDLLTIFFRVASLTLGQPYDCPSVSEVTLKDMGNISYRQNPMKYEPCVHNFLDVMCDWKRNHQCFYFTDFFTHWGWVTHICVRKFSITGSDNGLLPGRRQTIIWTNAGILLIGPLGTNLIEIYTFSFKKMYLNISSGKWWPFCLSLNVLIWKLPDM